MASTTLRIAMVAHEFTRTGAALAFFRLARHWRDRGHTITMYRSGRADGPVRAMYEAAGLPIEARLELGRYDLVVGNTICAAPIVARVAPNRPAIWWIHESEVGTGLVVGNPGWIEAFQRADATVFCTPAQRDLYRSFTPAAAPERLRVIPPDLDVDPATVDAARAPPKRKSLRVVQVGAIETRKRPGDLVLATQLSGADYECVLIGDFFGVRQEAQNLLDADPGRFRVIPSIDQAAVLDWVASADVYCLASSSETLPLSVHEAALLRRPLLLTDLACYDGVFRHGRNCMMAPVGDVEMLAASLAILAARASLRTRLGNAARLAAVPLRSERTHTEFDHLIEDVMLRRG